MKEALEKALEPIKDIKEEKLDLSILKKRISMPPKNRPLHTGPFNNKSTFMLENRKFRFEKSLKRKRYIIKEIT